MNLSSRKFIVVLLVMVLATVTLWVGKIDQTVFKGLLELAFMVYVGGNLGEHFIKGRSSTS